MPLCFFTFSVSLELILFSVVLHLFVHVLVVAWIGRLLFVSNASISVSAWILSRVVVLVDFHLALVSCPAHALSFTGGRGLLCLGLLACLLNLLLAE